MPIKIKGVIISMGAILGLLYGEINGAFSVLIFFMITDYITGIICAMTKKNLSSKIGYLGILRKMLTLMVIALGYTIDKYIINSGDILKTSLIFFYLSNEGISILENITCLGVPVPHKLRQILLQLHKENNK